MNQDIYVVIEHLRGQVADISYMMLAAARQLAQGTGGEVVAVLLGHDAQGLAAKLAARRVLYIDHPALADFTSDAYHQVLNKLIAENQPRAVLLGNTSVGADVASRFNLINRVVPPNQHLAVAEEMARKITQNAPIAVQGMKEATAMGLELPLKERMRCAKLIQNRVKQSKDYYEGMRAFAEKRKPVWKGE